MSEAGTMNHKIGWIGTGRMGYSMVSRLLKKGCDVHVFNRTRAKAEPLSEIGARIVDNPSDLAGRDIVFSMVSGPDDLKHVVLNQETGLVAGEGTTGMLVDCSSISTEASSFVREALRTRGTAMLAAPVSGNAKVVKAGKLAIVASGPEESYALAEPYLDAMGKGTSYVGSGELARMVKICHNILLGVYTQSLAEIVVLAEKGGVPRHAFMDFINKSVMGSTFSKYKSNAIVNLDWTTTFTPHLLKKDLDLGLAAGRELGVPQLLTAVTRDLVQVMIGQGYEECDFMAILEVQAKASGHELISENLEIDDGLSD